MQDAELNYWADRYIASNVRDGLTFDRFLALSPALRERRLAQQAEIDALRSRVERTAASTAAHDGKLIAPIKRPPPFRLRKPWFFRQRTH